MIKELLETFLTAFFGILFNLGKNKKESADIEKVISLYKGKGFAATFARIRVWDSPLKEVEKEVVRKGLVIDLGSGNGLFANYLALVKPQRRILGIEMNKSRVKESNKGVGNVEFRNGNILEEDFPRADSILLVHVLHHLPSFQDQVKIIKKCREKLEKGGSLIIVEIKRHPILKFLLTYFTDVFVFPILFNGSLDLKIYYRTEKEWINLLKKEGFIVNVIEAHKSKPFSHFILSCRI